MLDFTQKGPSEAFTLAFNELVDAAVKADRERQPVRTYLGGSRLGEECERRLAYEWHDLRAGRGATFEGRTLRIFQRGHDCETRMANYLRLAGFELLTEKQGGHQFGFGVAPDPETGKSRISGHLDGVIVGWRQPQGVTLPPSVIELIGRMRFPCLWECKGINDKAFNKYLKEGVRKANRVYYFQMQSYMAYMGLHENPALFTAENQNDCRICPELVPFNLKDAQEASDKGVRVISSSRPEELPRVARQKDDFRCKWCDHHDRCWSAPEPSTNAQPTISPAWLPSA